MARAGSVSTKRVAELLKAPTGLADSIAALSLVDGVTMAAIGPSQIIEINAAPEAVEKQIGIRYPIVNVYCDKVANTQHEKFRTISGTARVNVEIRVTSDQLWGLSDGLHLYVEAITRVLDASRGEWGMGLFYAGGYEIAYNAVKPGGRNYIQSAKVSMTIDISS